MAAPADPTLSPGTFQQVLDGSDSPLEFPAAFIEFDGKNYMGNSNGLWELNGSDPATLAFSGVVSDAVVFDGDLFFAESTTSGSDLYRWNGNDAPSLVDDLNPTGDAFPHSIRELGGVAYFVATDGVRNPGYRR